jgi:hypothetical protein
MSRTSLLPLLSLVAVVSAGCPTASSLTSARTLDKGGLELTVAPTVINSVMVRSDQGQPRADYFGLPSAEAQMRYGITDHVEVGAKLWFGGFAGHLKLGLLRSETAEDGFNLSFDPGISYMGLGTGDARVDLVHVYLPVLAGYRFGGHEVTFGPRLVPVFAGVTAGSDGSARTTFLGGASLGLSLRLGRAFQLRPELSLLAPMDQSNSDAVGGVAQLSLGFSFDAN